MCCICIETSIDQTITDYNRIYVTAMLVLEELANYALYIANCTHTIIYGIDIHLYNITL